jgi:hypothetical protein
MRALQGPNDWSSEEMAGYQEKEVRMRKTRFFTGFLVGSLLLIALCSGAAQAQVDLTIWNGSLWQVKQTIKGFYWGEASPQTSPGRSIGGSDSAYGVLTLGAPSVILNLYLYIPGIEECQYFMTIPLSYVAGSDLDFIGLYYREDLPAFDAGLLRFSGTSDEGTLKKGKVASLGAITIQEGFDDAGDLLVSGLIIKGKVIQQKQLKCQIPPP